MKKVCSLLAFIFLAGCGSRIGVENAQRNYEMLFEENGLQLRFPKDAHFRFDRPDGSIVFATNSGQDGPNDYFITVYVPEKEWTRGKYGMVDSRVLFCSPSLTGASTITSLPGANGEAGWGRVDAFDLEDEYGTWPEGYEPPEYIGDILCNTNGAPKPKEIYALCSEKDGKTVVICISQMKDNPTMAEEIFKTFRWTK